MVSKARKEKIKRVLSLRQPDLVLVVDDVRSPHNFSALLRTAEAMAFLEVHAVVPIRKASLVQKGIAQGAYRWLEIKRWNSPKEPLSRLKSEGFKIVTTALDERARDFREIDYTVPVAIVMGNEAEGVSRTSLEMADEIACIPMYGMVQSLNVSVAFGMMAREAINQREKKGMLSGKTRLSPERYALLLARYLDQEKTIREVADHLSRRVRDDLRGILRGRPFWMVGLYDPSEETVELLEDKLFPLSAREYRVANYVFFAVPHLRKNYGQLIEEVLSEVMEKDFLVFYSRYRF